MKSCRFVFNLPVISGLVLTFSVVGHAQATRTWVSGVGDDVNPCSRTAPCKTFAGAISKTASPGEIDCLDPGGFGAVTITKSITIDCRSGLGSVLSSGVQGIVINAQATDVVTLRNLAIQGAGTTLGTNGINIISAKAVHLENVTINNYSNACLQVSATASTKVTAKDVTMADCASGVIVTTTIGTASVDLYRVHISNASTDGVQVGSNASIDVRDSYLGYTGTAAHQTSSSAILNLVGCEVTHNTTGFMGSPSAQGGVFNTVFSSNTTAFTANGGTIFTDGSSNLVVGNASNGSALTILNGIKM